MHMTALLRNKTLVAVLVSSFLLGIKSRAIDYYVSPTGSDANTGLSTSQPWTITKGILWLTNGNTVWMMDGSYSSFRITNSVDNNNLTLKASLKALNYKSAIVDGAGTSYCIDVASSNVHIRGLVISNAVNGIRSQKHGVEIKNNRITKCTAIAISIIHPINSYSNLVEHNEVIDNPGGAVEAIQVRSYDNIIRNNLIISNGNSGLVIRPVGIGEGLGELGATNNYIYNNIVSGHTGLGTQIISTSANGNVDGTNFIYNNTLLDGLYNLGGTPYTYNNVIYPASAYPNYPILTNPNATYVCNDITKMDYNFATNTLVGAGANDLIIANYSKTTLFPSNAFNQFWLSYTNPLRLVASRTTSAGPVDFFGRARLFPYDIGAIQYEEEFETDTRDLNNRNLDPYLCNVPAFRVVGHKAYHNVRWNVTALNVTGHALYRKEGAGAYTKIADIAPRDINYVDLTGSLIDGTVYTYKLTSTNLYGNTIDSQPYIITCDKLSTVHPDRRITWGTNITGLPNGSYPTHTVWSDITTNIPGTNIVVTGDGSTDNRGAFAAALRLAPSNSVILIGSNGIYDVSGTIGFLVQNLTSNNNKILRGVSSNVIIRAKSGFTGGSIFQMGQFNEQGTDRIISSRLPRGSTQMTWPGGYGVIPIQVGSLINIWQNNASGRWGANTTTGGDADPVYNSNDGTTLVSASAPLVRQMVMVTSLPGSGVINFEPPLMFDFSKEAICHYQYLWMCNNSGVENITFDNTVDSATTNNVLRIMDIEGTYGCWTRNVRTLKARSAHIRMQYALRNQIDGNWLDDAVSFTANAGIGLQLLRDVCSSVFMNTIYKTVFPHVEKQKAVNGNVFAGNFYWDPRGGLAPMDNHGGHNQYNLYEFEDGYGTVKDGYFNSEQDSLYHRCYYTGYATNFGARKIMNLGRFTRGISIENTRLGLNYTNWTTEIYTNGWNNAWSAIYRWGYPNMGNDNYTGSNSWYHYTNMASLDTTGVKADAIIHGVYNTATGAMEYDPSNASRTWRYSYFNEWNNPTPPTWYTNAVWPANGVDSGTFTTNFTTAGNYFWSTTLSYIPPAMPVLPIFQDLGPIPSEFYIDCPFPE